MTAIQELFAHLPKDIPAAILITLHVGRHKSVLPAIIRHYGFAAYHARQGALISPPCIIVAPPDHHLLIRRGHVALSRGPRENWARPAIDPMFRSAANAYDGHVIGVILSGYLNDGTAGLFAVKRRGVPLPRNHRVLRETKRAAAMIASRLPRRPRVSVRANAVGIGPRTHCGHPGPA